jgi:hypothetical protein
MKSHDNSGMSLDVIQDIADAYIWDDAHEMERMHARHGGAGVIQSHCRLMAHPEGGDAPHIHVMNVTRQVTADNLFWGDSSSHGERRVGSHPIDLLAQNLP